MADHVSIDPALVGLLTVVAGLIGYVAKGALSFGKDTGQLTAFRESVQKRLDKLDIDTDLGRTQRAAQQVAEQRMLAQDRHMEDLERRLGIIETLHMDLTNKLLGITQNQSKLESMIADSRSKLDTDMRYLNDHIDRKFATIARLIRPSKDIDAADDT